MNSETSTDSVGSDPPPSEEALKIARHYADAFLNAADGEAEPDAFLDEIEEINRDVFRPNPKLVQVLGSVTVPQSERERIVLELFDRRASDLTVRFLRVLNRHGRLGLFSTVAEEARKIWNNRHNRVPVEVRTAAPLDEAQRGSLGERVGRMIGAIPILNVSTDPSLIGGLVIKVGDYVYDASVKNRLEQLRQRLIEGKTHEIQSRRDQFSYPA